MSAESPQDTSLDPTAERVADFVTGQVASLAASGSSADEFERRSFDL